MNDVVGRGVIEVDLDGSGIKAGVEEGKRSLADLTKSAVDAGQRAQKGMDSIGTGSDSAARKIEISTKSIINSIQRQIAVMEAGSKTGSKYFEAIAKQRGVPAEALKPYLTQLDAVAASQKRVGLTAGETANALRILPAQITDITVGLSTGQSPFYVLLQQGGQLKDMFGGIGPAARAVGGYVAKLINPFTLAAGAVAALTLAYKQGSDEQTAYAKAIIATGNFAGVTTGNLADMAKAIGGQVGSTHAAAKILEQLVATGLIYGDQLQSLALAAAEWERATGTAAQTTIAEFSQLAKDPVSAAQKLNEKYHFLTLAVYEQIEALDRQGRREDAAVIAEKAFAAALDQRAKDVRASLGIIERGWDNVKTAAAGAWDGMLDIGREHTLEQRIAKLKEQIAQLNNPVPGAPANAQNGQSAALQQQLKVLEEQRRIQKETEDAKARAAGEDRRVQDEGIVAENKIAKIRDDSLSNTEKRQKAITDYLRDIEKIRAANPASPLLNSARIANDLKNIGDKFKSETEDSVKSLENQAAAYGQSAAQAKILELRSKGATAEEIKRAEAAQKTIDANIKVDETYKSNTDLLERVTQLGAEALTPEARSVSELKEKYDDLDEAVKRHLISQEEAAKSKNGLSDNALLSVSDFAKTEEQRLADSYTRRLKIVEDARQLDLGNDAKYQDIKKRLEEKYTEDSEKLSKSYWYRYLKAAEKNLANFNTLTQSTIETFTRGFGDAFEKVIFDSQSAGDAFRGLMQGMARAVVNALGQMAAQWLAYELIQIAVGKGAQAAAAGTLIANAEATSLQAQIAAFASTAAIPIVGPALAPEAMAAAAAITEPLVVAISSLALAGIAHAGMSNIPREGTWLLNGGERVVAPQQNRDLTEYLSEKKKNSNPNSLQDRTQLQLPPIVINAVDARSIEKLLRANGGAVARSLAEQARNYYRPAGS